MPNLYKQYFVHNEPDKTRVINSDDIVEKRLEKMAELKRREQKTTDENGFSAGIVGPDTDYVEEIDHVAEAKKEAEKILAEAQAQAQAILNQANQEAEDIRENAKIPDIRREDRAWRVNWQRSVKSYRTNIRANRKRFRMNSGRNNKIWKRIW